VLALKILADGQDIFDYGFHFVIYLFPIEISINAPQIQESYSRRMAMRRRDFLALAAGSGAAAVSGQRLVVSVQVMFDRGAHGGRGLQDREVSRFAALQDEARREYATSGIDFELHTLEGAFLRQQGYSAIPDKFLTPGMINLFVTDSLGYDIDKDRTGGCSIGPRAPDRRSGGHPFYITFLGLHDAHDTTLPHEYAHHFTLDTRRSTGVAGNFWADLRNDYWLWRQRHGAAIPEFRRCAGSPWARFR
jgi:hypothetical protein